MTIVVRGPSWVGDALLARPALWRLRQSLPAERLSLWSPAKLLDLYRGMGLELNPLPDRSNRLLLPPVSSLWRSLAPDAALLLAPSLRAGLEAALARIPIRIGYPDDHRRLLLTHPATRSRPSPAHRHASFAQHVADEQLELVSQLLQVLGQPRCTSMPPMPPLVVPLEAHECVRLEASRRAFEPARPRIGLYPTSAGGPTRDWPLDKHRLLLERLVKNYDPTLTVFGGPGDGPRLEPLIRGILPDVALLAGTRAPSLLELAAHFSRLDLLIAHDTGPMHLAATMGTPLVVLYGSTLPAITGPWRYPHEAVRVPGLHCAGCYLRRCPYQLECLVQLEVDAVLEAVQRVLEGPAQHSRATNRESACASW